MWFTFVCKAELGEASTTSLGKVVKAKAFQLTGGAADGLHGLLRGGVGYH